MVGSESWGGRIGPWRPQDELLPTPTPEGRVHQTCFREDHPDRSVERAREVLRREAGEHEEVLAWSRQKGWCLEIEAE